MHDRGGIWIAAVAWFIGLAALLCDRFQPSALLVVGMRTLFGIAVCAAICLVLIPPARALAGANRLQLHLHTRLVSHWVYILLYALAAVRVGMFLYDQSQHCTLCAARGAAASVRPLDDFLFYIACCIAPLWVVRAMVLTR